MFNEDLTCYRFRPAQQQATLFRNAASDEIIFVQQGSGDVLTTYGTLPYRRGDYLVMPRTTICFRRQVRSTPPKLTLLDDSEALPTRELRTASNSIDLLPTPQ